MAERENAMVGNPIMALSCCKTNTRGLIISPLHVSPNPAFDSHSLSQLIHVEDPRRSDHACEMFLFSPDRLQRRGAANALMRGVPLRQVSENSPWRLRQCHRSRRFLDLHGKTKMTIALLARRCFRRTDHAAQDEKNQNPRYSFLGHNPQHSLRPLSYKKVKK